METGLFVFSLPQLAYGPGVNPIPQVFYVLIHRRTSEGEMFNGWRMISSFFWGGFFFARDVNMIDQRLIGGGRGSSGFQSRVDPP